MLETRNITVNYGVRAAVADVSLRAEPGEMLEQHEHRQAH